MVEPASIKTFKGKVMPIKNLFKKLILWIATKLKIVDEIIMNERLNANKIPESYKRYITYIFYSLQVGGHAWLSEHDNIKIQDVLGYKIISQDDVTLEEFLLLIDADHRRDMMLCQISELQRHTGRHMGCMMRDIVKPALGIEKNYLRLSMAELSKLIEYIDAL